MAWHGMAWHGLDTSTHVAIAAAAPDQHKPFTQAGGGGMHGAASLPDLAADIDHMRALQAHWEGQAQLTCTPPSTKHHTK